MGTLVLCFTYSNYIEDIGFAQIGIREFMNQILEWLSGGDQRSDGIADEVVSIILDAPQIFDDLYEGLSHPDKVVRGRAADALEKIARTNPEFFETKMQGIIQFAKTDEHGVVRFHLAMLLGHLAGSSDEIDAITKALMELLQDKGAFVKSWTIASLCIIGRLYPSKKDDIIYEISTLEHDPSIAVRTRVHKGLKVLLNEKAPFPPGWIKSQQNIKQAECK